MSHITPVDLQQSGMKKMWSVTDFARRYRLDKDEENRLLQLLGSFASEQELLMNASRTARFR
jgi:hypothetical protein